MENWFRLPRCYALPRWRAFETRDVESLREHYALTLRRWVRRLERRHEEAAQVAGEHAYRVWRLYMAGSARAFAMGRIGIVQALFGRD